MVLSVKGGRILSVSAHRKQSAQLDNLAVNVDVRGVTNASEHLVLQYEYTVSYVPNVAELKISGEAWLDGTKEERKRVEDEWKKSKQLPVDAAEEFLNAMSYTGATVGTLLAYAINVRAPINLPRISLQKAAVKPPAPKTQAG